MKIALVGRYGEGEIITGPERVARELYSELNRKNIEVVFLEYFFSGYKGTSLFKKLFGKQYIEDQSILRLGILPLILKIFKNKFEIIHIVNSQRFILFLLLLKPFIVGKIVTTLHGSIVKEIPKSKLWSKRFFIDLWVEKLVVNKSTILIFPSSLLYNIFDIQYGIPNKKYQIIPNGVSKTFNVARLPFPHVGGSIKFVFYNGYNTSIDRGLEKLLKRLGSIKIKIELFIFGKQINLVSFNSNIILHFVSQLTHQELIEFLLDKHFVIKSITFDTFPIMVAECMTLGIIPIVEENIGIKAFIDDEVNGFTYSVNNSEELTELIKNISNGKYDLKMISSNAKKIYTELNWQNITKKYLDVYKTSA